jgi:hypothetical protein
MFQAQSTHHQEVNDANCTYVASGIVTLCKWPSCATAKEFNLCIKLVIIKKYRDVKQSNNAYNEGTHYCCVNSKYE